MSERGLTPVALRAALVSAALVGLVGAGAPPAIAQPRTTAVKYEGRTLADALRTLQAGGLRIVFSSRTVTPELRVASEPRAKAARQILDELLAAHSLRAEEGPGGVLQIVRAKTTPAPRARTPPKTATPGKLADQTYTERVTVTAPHPHRQDAGVSSETGIGTDEIRAIGAAAVSDPMLAVVALPRIATGDDFRSEFSVRGSPSRHIGIVVDGVATRWLQHTAYGRGDTGSVAMLNGEMLERATLQAGAYPHRYGDRIGAELSLTLREGSRASTRFRGALSGTNAAIVAEGPLGREHHGSWLLTFRRSYRDLPIDVDSRAGTLFDLADAQAKLVYDVRSSQQVSLTMVGGRASLEGPDDRRPWEFGNGMNRTALVNLAWRSTFGDDTVVSQRAYVVTHDFFNGKQTERDGSRGTDREIAYRVDLTRATVGGLLEAGGQVQRLRVSQRSIDDASGSDEAPAIYPIGNFAGSAWLRSGYAHFKWSAAPGLVIAPGMRISGSTLVGRPALSRWVLGEWSFRPGWALHASAGHSHQLPELDQGLGEGAASDLRPERATHLDTGLEQHVGKGLRWQATLFHRRERDVLDWAGTRRFTNGLDGSAAGVELLIERRRSTGLSGWAAVSYGKTRYTDAVRGETFWGDFDQRHGINASGLYRVSERTTVAATFRAGTNFPIPGRLESRDGRLFAGDARNAVRLPGYARLDVRTSRAFTYGGRRVTLFVEILNVLNKTNIGLADGVVSRTTGEAIGFTEPLFRRRPSLGLVIDF